MKTHVDTAAALRMRDTDNFARVSRGMDYVHWGPMTPETTFFEEDDPVLEQLLEKVPEAERVRVTRVIDVVT